MTVIVNTIPIEELQTLLGNTFEATAGELADTYRNTDRILIIGETFRKFVADAIEAAANAGAPPMMAVEIAVGSTATMMVQVAFEAGRNYALANAVPIDITDEEIAQMIDGEPSS